MNERFDELYDTTMHDSRQEVALCVVKPDGMKRNLLATVIQELLGSGLNIVFLQRLTMTRDEAERLYEFHRGADYFCGQVDFMTSGPVTVIVVEGSDCSQRLRKLVKQLRATWSPNSVRENVVHGSDSADSGVRETQIFFPA